MFLSNPIIILFSTIIIYSSLLMIENEHFMIYILNYLFMYYVQDYLMHYYIDYYIDY